MALKKCKECGTEISSSAKVCPNCGKNQKNFFQKHIILTIILILIALVIVAGGSSSNNNTSPTSSTLDSSTESTSTTSSTTPNVPTEITYTTISVDELEDALENNAAAAKDTYVNQYVELTGKLSNIDSDLKYINLESTTKDFDLTNIQCYIKDNTQKEIVKTLSKDSSITIRGQVKDVGEVLGYSINITEIVQ